MIASLVETGDSLAAVLAARGLLRDEAIERIEAAARRSELPFSAVAVRLGLVGEWDMAQALSALCGLSIAGAGDYPDRPVEIADLNEVFLRERAMVVLAADVDHVDVAMADPLDDQAAAAVAYCARRPVRRRVALASDVQACEQAHAERAGLAAEAAVAGPLPAARLAQDDLTRLSEQTSTEPVIANVNRILTRATELGASDIHLEPEESGLAVRMRVDGMLQEVETLGARWIEPIASRVKLMARLDIAEKRLPQDGRMQFSVKGRPLDLRVATFPTLRGESIVLRLLGRSAVDLKLAALGLSAQGLADIGAALAQPHGIVLLTGPTGSGKTTTLYAALQSLLKPELKVITVEDPVEYTLPGVAQMQLRSDIGLSYPVALRSILRNDPDVIMIGEIRDAETADIAVRAALTGHLVLSTLHTNSAAGAVTRLLDLGIEDYLLASTLALTAAQRLVRRLCVHCRRPRLATPEERALLVGELAQPDLPVALFDAVGCPRCQQRGYAGRTSIIETVRVGDVEREMIRHWRDEAAFGAGVQAGGSHRLWRHGLHKVLAGETTLAELGRVVECPSG